MLHKVRDPLIETDVRDVAIAADAHLHVKFLDHAQQSGPTLLLIHGGGAGANHTIVERPARWLMHHHLYGEVILPDRRGNGASSPLTHVPTFRDHADDMVALLDALDETGPLDVMGVSYGGPIALTHGALDDRVARVILYASSPAMRFSWPWSWLIRSGIVPFFMRRLYEREIGKAEPRYVDLDVAYEQQSQTEDWETYKRALNHTPAKRLDSILYEFEANQRPEYTRIADDLTLAKPVLRVIGSDDQTWGSDWPPAYHERFPDFHQVLVPGADHKDAIREADRFLQRLAALLAQQRHSASAPA